MVNPAKVSFSTQGDVTIIHLPAELIDPLDIATARDAWRAHVQAHKPHRIVVNFDLLQMSVFISNGCSSDQKVTRSA